MREERGDPTCGEQVTAKVLSYARGKRCETYSTLSWEARAPLCAGKAVTLSASTTMGTWCSSMCGESGLRGQRVLVQLRVPPYAPGIGCKNVGRPQSSLVPIGHTGVCAPDRSLRHLNGRLRAGSPFLPRPGAAWFFPARAVFAPHRRRLLRALRGGAPGGRPEDPANAPLRRRRGGTTGTDCGLRRRQGVLPPRGNAPSSWGDTLHCAGRVLPLQTRVAPGFPPGRELCAAMTAPLPRRAPAAWSGRAGGSSPPARARQDSRKPCRPRRHSRMRPRRTQKRGGFIRPFCFSPHQPRGKISLSCASWRSPRRPQNRPPAARSPSPKPRPFPARPDLCRPGCSGHRGPCRPGCSDRRDPDQRPARRTPP